MTTKRTLTAVAGIVAGLALLAGCTPEPTVTPTPTITESATPIPTPTTIGTPESEGAAIEAAEATLLAYNEAFDQIGIDGWTNYERLQELATGLAYDQGLPGIEQLRSEGRTQTGISTLEILNSTIAPNQDGIEFGTVSIRACVDPTTRNQMLADGSPAPLPDPARSIKEASVSYFADQGKWLVTDYGDPAAGRTPC
jgi:hypothetical protein